MISGTLWNSMKTYTSFKFKVRVTNTPPRFTTQLQSRVQLFIEDSKIISLPYVMDAENNSWRMRIFEQNKRYLPSFIELQVGYLVIKPKKNDVGKYPLQLEVIDEFDASSTYLISLYVMKNDSSLPLLNSTNQIIETSIRV